MQASEPDIGALEGHLVRQLPFLLNDVDMVHGHPLPMEMTGLV